MDTEFLKKWGFRGSLENASGIMGRITMQHRSRFSVETAKGSRTGVLRGKLKQVDLLERPTVDDWVTLSGDGDGAVAIESVLERHSLFLRRDPGVDVTVQLIAANVDTLLLVMGLDGNFNVRRLERTLALAHESRARPVIILSKIDLAYDLDEQISEVKAHAPGIPVLALSALSGEGVHALDEFMKPGDTLALVGSSGVGKSTLLNLLMKENVSVVGPTREWDDRGRHTTSSRGLYMLPNGALLMDTPGMRTLRLWDAGAGVNDVFPEIAELAQQCKFRGCTHTHEPGCAVLEAVEKETLDYERFDSFMTLQAELQGLEAERSPSKRRAKKAEERQASRALRQWYRGDKR